MNILVISAHPDDEVLGMGGTIKKLTRNGNNVEILIMATGITSRRSVDYSNRIDYSSDETVANTLQQQIKDLRNDAKKAAKILGVKNIEFLDFPDNEMDTVSSLQITKKIEKTIAKFKPDSVYTHSHLDVNIDHRIIHHCVLTATRPKINNSVKEVISFEVPSSTEWYFTSNFTPNFFVNISRELKIKQKALCAYKNEIRKFPHPRSTEAVEIIAKRWGTVSGFKAAEAFSLIRKLD